MDKFRKFLFLFLISYLSLPISYFSFAQTPFKAGISAGITTTQIDGDGYSGFDKAGLTVGGFVNNNFGADKWCGQMELLYVQKGSRRPPNPEKGVSLYQINLSYVEIPVLAKFQHKKLVYEAGFSFGQLIRHREFDASGELFYAPPFKKNEFALNGGASIFFTEKLSLNARFVRSILPVRDYVYLARFGLFGFIGGSYNTALLYTLRYQFGKKEEKQKRKEEEKGKNIINEILKIE